MVPPCVFRMIGITRPYQRDATEHVRPELGLDLFLRKKPFQGARSFRSRRC